MLSDLILFAPFLTFISIFFPTFFTLSYILVNIWFGGFIIKGTWLYYNFENILFLFDISGLFSILLILLNKKIDHKFIKLFLFYIAFYIFFLFLGTSQNGGSLWSALSSSKGVSSLIFIFFLQLKYKDINYNLFIKCIIFISLYESFLQHLYYFFNIYPYGYNLVNPLDSYSGLQFKHPLILMVALLIFHASNFKIFKNIFINYFFYLIICFALITQEHRSVIIGYLFLLYLVNQNKLFGIDLGYLISIFAIIFLTYDVLNEAFYEINNISGSVLSRINIQGFRVELIREKILLGWGFIGKSSDLGNLISSMSVSPHTELISTVDSGFIDLLIKFGVLGTMIYILFLYRISTFIHPSYNRYYKILLYCFVLISFTLSPLTYHFGLIPLAIFFLFQKYNNLYI